MNIDKPLKICVEKHLEKDELQITKLINIKHKDNKEYSKLKAAFVTSKLWPNNSTIKIGFIEEPSANLERTPLSSIKRRKVSYDPLQDKIIDMDIISAIKLIINERIQPIVNLTLQFVNNVNDAHVKISFDPTQGAWSLLGTDCLQETGATMNFGWFDVATVIHEFGHMLGLIHEHQNPRGKTIEWNVEKVYQWAADTQGWDQQTTYNNIIQKYSVNETNGSEYDPQSIMLYFFPAELTLNNKGTDMNLRLSPNDVLYINSQYPENKISPEDFYKQAYGENLKSNLLNINLTNNYNIFYIILTIIIIIILIYLLSKYLENNSPKTKYTYF
jgi:hypothetical protein